MWPCPPSPSPYFAKKSNPMANIQGGGMIRHDAIASPGSALSRDAHYPCTAKTLGQEQRDRFRGANALQYASCFLNGGGNASAPRNHGNTSDPDEPFASRRVSASLRFTPFPARAGPAGEQPWCPLSRATPTGGYRSRNKQPDSSGALATVRRELVGIASSGYLDCASLSTPRWQTRHFCCPGSSPRNSVHPSAHDAQAFLVSGHSSPRIWQCLHHTGAGLSSAAILPRTGLPRLSPAARHHWRGLIGRGANPPLWTSFCERTRETESPAPTPRCRGTSCVQPT